MTPFTTSSLRVSVYQVQGLAIAACLCLTACHSACLAADEPANADATTAKTPADMKPYKQQIRNTDVSYEMVPIPGGEFVMGSPAQEASRGEGEGPQHKVKVEPFWMGKYEVTWDEFELWSLRLERSLRKYKKAETSTLEKAADAITKPTNPYTDM